MASKPPVCLTIAGLDPSGGAGVIADIKTFSAFGCFACAAISSITFQNTTGVFGAVAQSGDTVRQQVEPVLADLTVAAIKTGMLPSAEVIEATARLIEQSGTQNIVVDPVVRSTSGFDLIDDAALASLISRLFPIALMVTPNIPEAERITGLTLRTPSDFAGAGRKMLEMGARNVLIKGGHADEAGSAPLAIDYLFSAAGTVEFAGPRLDTGSTHGTGCTLSAAIAANLALGKSVEDSVKIAKDFVFEGIRTSPGLGRGHSPLNIPAIWQEE